MTQDETILETVEAYYTSKLKTHGAVPQGVDWKDQASQLLRFDKLLEIVGNNGPYSINDFGCGFGCLVERLPDQGHPFTYHGADISNAMIEEARARYAQHSHAHFYGTGESLPISDYTVASGIFNVRLGHSDAGWEGYIEGTIEKLDRLSRRGFSFNMLTSYSDADKKRPDLYYADPLRFFDLCKRRYSRHVALLHDYGLYEFTLLVRKDL